MKRHTFSIFNFQFSMLLCALALSSCRPQSDDLLSYGQNDYQAFYEANKSYAGEFKAFWTAMNENYGIWDYEASFGVDWDEVYRTYLPQFEAWDQREENVTDDEFRQRYEEITDRLHDGHLSLSIKNIHTGHYISFQPQSNRVTRERGEEMSQVRYNLTDLHAYLAPEAGSYQTKDYDATGSTAIILEITDSALCRAVRAVDAYITMVDDAGGPDATNDKVYNDANQLKIEAEKLLGTLHTLPMSLLTMYKSTVASSYERIIQTYGYLGKQLGFSFPAIEKDIKNDRLGYISYALFDGNIAYMRLGNFGLLTHLNAAYRSHDTASTYYAYQQAVIRVWHHWFDTIQSLHKAGTLGGVIIDVRNNTGGYVNDYQYVMGALLPSGGWESHTLRMKNGVGRLDYGPLTPFRVETYPDEHEVVNDRPIVVLANCWSVSMAENTTWGVMSQPNGCFIGTRTFGGLSALNDAPEHYSDNYSGAFGVQGVTPIYGYIPKYICLYGDDHQPVEGVGFSPDIELPLDVSLWQSTRRDNQLEKAIDYIRSK